MQNSIGAAGVDIVVQAIQVRAGVAFTTGEIVGPIAGFCVLAVIAIWMLGRVMHHVADDTAVVGAGAPQALRSLG